MYLHGWIHLYVLHISVISHPWKGDCNEALYVLSFSADALFYMDLHSLGNLFPVLTLSTMGKIFSSRHIKIYINSFDISCKLSPMEKTICMKCQNLFSRKSKKNITNLLSAELTQRVVMVNKPWLTNFC